MLEVNNNIVTIIVIIIIILPHFEIIKIIILITHTLLALKKI